MYFSIRTGLVAGRQHTVYGINCQDSVKTKSFLVDEAFYHVGVVADGCGEGTQTETGAHLAVAFLTHRMELLLKAGVSPLSVPRVLFSDLIDYLGNITKPYTSPSERVQFIKNNLLFTVLGFLIAPETTVVYALGDGVVVLNDLIDIRDENNHPSYIAYHLVDTNYLTKDRSTLPDRFAIYTIPTPELVKLAVATDAWIDEMEILKTIWYQDLCPNLQRTMNMSSRKNRRFKDDAAIIAVQRIEVETNESYDSRKNNGPS